MNERGRPEAAPGSHGEEARYQGTPLSAYLDHFRFRVLQDALNEATVMYWVRRAEALERALPRRGDFHGAATPDELRERYNALQAEAMACRRHANLLASRAIVPADAAEDVARVLAEVAS